MQPAPSKTKVLIADDHTLLRRLLADMLAGREDIEIVGEAAGGLEAINKARQARPDLILMDLRMPGTNGVEATRIISQEMPATAILMLTMSEEDEDLVAALKAGAKGYLLKNVEPAELINSIQLLRCGHAVIHPRMATRLFSEASSPAKPEAPATVPSQNSGLTEREKELLNLLAQGATNKEIARSLSITETTVKAHVHNILNKLHLYNRVQAAKWAMENGIVKPPLR